MDHELVYSVLWDGMVFVCSYYLCTSTLVIVAYLLKVNLIYFIH